MLEAEVGDLWLRGAISYHLGWAGADFAPLPAARRGGGGKRLRPALALLCYQAGLEAQGRTGVEDNGAIAFATALLQLAH